MVLIFLADSANDHGRTWHGLRSISAHCNALSISAVHKALCYLRDDLKVLTWEQGSGGPNRKDTNTYQLDLAAMQQVVATQGVFDSSSGKLLHAPEPQSLPVRGSESVPVRGSSVVSFEALVVSSEASVVSAEGGSRFLPQEANPHDPPERNPHIEPRLLPDFYADASLHIPAPAGHSLAPCPPLARPPQPFSWGDEVAGYEFRKGDDAGYWNARTGQRATFEEVQTSAMAPMEQSKA